MKEDQGEKEVVALVQYEFVDFLFVLVDFAEIERERETDGPY